MNMQRDIMEEYRSISATDALSTPEQAQTRIEDRNMVPRFFERMQMADRINWYNNSIIALFVIYFLCTFIEEYVPVLIGWGRPTAFVVSLIGLVWVLLGKSEMKRDLVTPIVVISSEMRRLSNGARDIRIAGQQRQDELGDLARSLGAFASDYTRLDTLLAERDASEQLAAEAAEERQRELIRLADDFQATVGEIAGSVATAAKHLNATAADMATTAHGSSETAKFVADAVKRASNGAVAAAAASDEFALSIEEISRQATQSEDLARNAARVTEETDETISTLADSAQEISQVVELIQAIASRTNLLALNASIEAARGGESGRGFAVVAAEVKELAAQTSRATEDVAGQIRTMQQSTDTGVRELRAIGERIRELETTSVSIAAAVDQQSVAGKELARSIDLSARETSDVESHADGLLTQANKVGQAADQLLGSSRELQEQSSMLTERARTFVERIRTSCSSPHG